MATAVAGLLALASCVAVDNFGDRGVVYNAQIASAQDRTLFLNILRAAYRRPMAFTSIAGVTGTATVSGQLGLTLPFAGDPNLLPYQVGPSVGASGGPTFTVNNLDSQEFMRGILAPVGTATIELFGQEGLPWQELYDLLIAEATVTDDAGRTVRLRNRPGGGEADFQAFLTALSETAVRTEEVDRTETLGPPLAAADLHALDAVAAAAQANFRLVRIDGARYQLQRTIVNYRFCVDRVEATAITFRTEDGAYHGITVTPAMRCGRADEAPPAGSATAPKDEATASRRMLGPAPSRAGRSPGIEATFRSAEGVTYFLGEVARQELCLEPDENCRESPILVGPAIGGQHLLRVERGGPQRGDVAAVSYLGQGFRLPGGADDRSAQVLTILGQLLDLNKSAKDNPAPSVVTLVGH